MDRVRPPRSFLQRWGGTGLRLVALSVALVLVYLGLRLWLGPSVSRQEIRTSLAEITPIEATIRATGNLVPEIEETLSSPIAAPVASIQAEAGQRVEEGAVLIQLHTTREQVTLDNLDEQIALKDTELRHVRMITQTLPMVRPGEDRAERPIRNPPRGSWRRRRRWLNRPRYRKTHAGSART